MQKLIRLLSVALLLGAIQTVILANPDLPKIMNGGEYTSIVEGYDWGPAVSKVVLSVGENVASVDWKDYTVFARRHTDCFEMPEALASGSREVVHAYVSDAKGRWYPEEKYITLVLAVAPNDPIGSPIQYSRNEGCRGNNWIDYNMTIIEKSSGKVWNTEVDRIVPPIENFDLSGKFTHDGVTMSYASFEPENTSGKSPLIIWLHGGGEGGTDASIPLIANKAANYASDEIQALFGGAYVLSPQSPTRWMEAANGETTRGQTDDIYFKALMALFRQYLAAHPDIDQDRIYVGGCSNGGYMTLKLVVEYPDFFAAAFPSALAYFSEYLTDDQIESIKDVPMWFVHSKDDPVTVPDKTVVPVYARLKAAGAKNVHLTYYDHVVDITGFYGGEDYHYSGHWSWIYCHANKCRRDKDGSLVMLDGRPVTIMEWLAAQKK